MAKKSNKEEEEEKEGNEEEKTFTYKNGYLLVDPDKIKSNLPKYTVLVDEVESTGASVSGTIIDLRASLENIAGLPDEYFLPDAREPTKEVIDKLQTKISDLDTKFDDFKGLVNEFIKSVSDDTRLLLAIADAKKITELENSVKALQESSEKKWNRKAVIWGIVIALLACACGTIVTLIATQIPPYFT